MKIFVKIFFLFVPFSFCFGQSVGIGIDIPEAKLHLGGDMIIDSFLTVPRIQLFDFGLGPKFDLIGNANATKFDWTPPGDDESKFTVRITDSGAPILGAQIFNFDITVDQNAAKFAKENDNVKFDLNSPDAPKIELNGGAGNNAQKFTWQLKPQESKASILMRNQQFGDSIIFDFKPAEQRFEFKSGDLDHILKLDLGGFVGPSIELETPVIQSGLIIDTIPKISDWFTADDQGNELHMVMKPDQNEIEFFRGSQPGNPPVQGIWHGNYLVTGDLQVMGIKNFKIDHPLDPENKYLVHSCIESPDVMNIYNGNIVTNNKGYAIVILPDYFEALNRDFKYQLTVLGSFAQAIVKEEIVNNQFVIQTNKPDIKVSWMVTGIRNDKYAREHPMEVEMDK